MSPELKSALFSKDEKKLEDAFINERCPEFFGVDWRAGDDEIVESCADCLHLASLTSEWVEDKLFMIFEGRRTLVPLMEDPGDRHITICHINDVLEGKYQLRFLVISHGSDTIELAALPSEEWQFLDGACPDVVRENFIDPRALPNLFTQFTEKDLPVPARARYLRMINRGKTAR